MSDAQLTGDRINEERAFIKRYTEGLASRKVEYPADYATPLDERPRKIPAVAVPVAAPPVSEDMDVDAPAPDTSISLTIKSLKPSLTIPVTAQLTDTVADLKAIVANSSSSAPAADSQRLLLKGKALADSKLLKEYAIESGATLHLMISKAPSTPSPAPPLSSSEATIPPPSATAPNPPSLTITTSIDDASKAGTSMPLTVADQSAAPLGPQPEVSSATFHTTVSEPLFWQRVHALCISDFETEQEANLAWETMFVSLKGRLSASEVAKIRDVVGVLGMNGR
ncbi:hypothetical protein L202_02979 [Cryptococcus amylolentus CBS 6039]|uniref:Ubiquitin-like domain-containing protein n=2 Tax=Cryptococcus amylolentus TaxID=104669 RepID=A0A1E3HYJ4_9TREE|nr:hypothetical protein L202_02979 [Cryptococcus amylolentus CBS 6039]ODN80836.1 hypothetical protein L202_02979 [Cryptococcus amylolentus CBS 6039]ODO09352.1 hypothetical protein I350_02952 [Cryptococcus amylolentus CBS 6273]